MTNTITVYGKPDCSQCDATQLQLQKVGASYNYVDLSERPDAIEVIKELGYLAAPVVYIDEDTHWAGFRRDLINKHAVVA